jgi:hypothetical protein
MPVPYPAAIDEGIITGNRPSLMRCCTRRSSSPNFLTVHGDVLRRIDADAHVVPFDPGLMRVWSANVELLR